MRNRIGWMMLLGSMVLIGAVLSRLPDGSLPVGSANAAPPEPTAEEMFKKAQVNGKYRMLLHKIKVDKDRETYPQLEDLGYRKRPEYAGHKDLSAGWWVYSAPYWYIWRDRTSVQRPKRGWGPEQAIGEPNTLMAGDI